MKFVNWHGVNMEKPGGLVEKVKTMNEHESTRMLLRTDGNGFSFAEALVAWASRPCDSVQSFVEIETLKRTGGTLVPRIRE
jgi:hypothetical protein